jgi:hypothetical protein
MIINFKIHEISWDIYKLIQILMLNYIKKRIASYGLNYAGYFFNNLSINWSTSLSHMVCVLIMVNCSSLKMTFYSWLLINCHAAVKNVSSNISMTWNSAWIFMWFSMIDRFYKLGYKSVIKVRIESIRGSRSWNISNCMCYVHCNHAID